MKWMKIGHWFSFIWMALAGVATFTNKDPALVMGSLIMSKLYWDSAH